MFYFYLAQAYFCFIFYGEKCATFSLFCCVKKNTFFVWILIKNRWWKEGKIYTTDCGFLCRNCKYTRDEIM